MRKFKRYQHVENWLLDQICLEPDFVNPDTFELVGVGFTLTEPEDNQNDHSDYEYAELFFRWLLSGNSDLSSELLQKNPWVARFTAQTGLPEGFSSTYGVKILRQLPVMLEELKAKLPTRRAYISILGEPDQVILGVDTTHEFPCTIGLHLLPRDGALHMLVNMRSNNALRVLPYDVYNFTQLLVYLAQEVNLSVGNYHHFMNSCHLFKGDVRRHLEQLKPSEDVSED